VPFPLWAVASASFLPISHPATHKVPARLRLAAKHDARERAAVGNVSRRFRGGLERHAPLLPFPQSPLCAPSTGSGQASAFSAVKAVWAVSA